MARKTYGSDLTDKQWKLIEPHIPPEKDFGRPRTTDMREVTNALLYMLRTGCQWDMLFDGAKKTEGRRKCIVIVLFGLLEWLHLERKHHHKYSNRYSQLRL